MGRTSTTVWADCETCGSRVVAGSHCPKAERCAHCGAEPGRSCRRPSGHRADRLHAARYRAAERLDRAAGVAYPEQLPLPESRAAHSPREEG